MQLGELGCLNWPNLRWTSVSDGLLSRKRFIVRLGRCEGVDSRGAKNPRLAVSIADTASKLKLVLARFSVDEKTSPIPESDLLRLTTILDQRFNKGPAVLITDKASNGRK